MLTLHTLPSTKQKKRKRLGRGAASGKGNYAGRGMKGQRARSGGKGGLQRRGLKASFMAVPKVRGFRSLYPRAQAVNLHQLNDKCDDNTSVTPAELLQKGLIKSLDFPVKILAQGKLKKKLQISAHAASEAAKKAIQDAGGTFTELKYTKKATRGIKKTS